MEMEIVKWHDKGDKGFFMELRNTHNTQWVTNPNRRGWEDYICNQVKKSEKRT